MKVRFSATIEVQDGMSESEIEEWIEFNLGVTGGLPRANPMSSTDIASVGCSAIVVEHAE